MSASNFTFMLNEILICVFFSIPSTPEEFKSPTKLFYFNNLNVKVITAKQQNSINSGVKD